MALRNTLLVCAAIVAGGGIAGMVVRSPNGWQSYDTGANSFAPAQPSTQPSNFAPAQPSTEPAVQPAAPVGGLQDPARRPQEQTLALSQIDQPARLLPRMPVENADGQRLGEVARVSLDSSGRLREIVLDHGERIAAADLVYLPERSVLVAQATPNGQGPSGQRRDDYGQRRSEPNAYGPPRNAPDGRGPPNSYGQPNGYGPPQAQPSEQRPDDRGDD